MTDSKIYLASHRRTKDLGTRGFRNIFEYLPDYYKIGIATDPKRRLSGMQTGTPHKLTLESVIETDDAKSVESELHSINSMRHYRGEWFQLPLNMTNSLKGLDYIDSDNIEAVRKYRDYEQPDWKISLYVQLMRVRGGEIESEIPEVRPRY